MIVIEVFIILIFVTLLIFGFLGFLAWQKIALFLTWNTRYDSAEYEQSMITPKIRKPIIKASKTEQRGRSITPVEDLVELTELDFETAASAIEKAGE